jgi:hypothetical protein
VGIAARLAASLPDANRGRIASAALWLTALCPFIANYAAVSQSEILATFFTTLAILIFLSPASLQMDLIRSDTGLMRSMHVWFAGGLVVGFGTLVRPETPLLLVAVLLALGIRYHRWENRKELATATLCVTLGLVLPLGPWATRNAVSLGRVQFLAPRFAETYGEVLPTGFYAWTRTWMFRFQDAYLFTWKLPSQPIYLKDLPAYATDSPEERSRVASLLQRYNGAHGMVLAVDREFADLARGRAQRHPVRTYVWIPIERAAAMWFTPRITLLPYSGRLWPLLQSYRNNPTDFAVTLGLASLNILYLTMALIAAWSGRTNTGILLIGLYVVVRTMFLTQLITCEPRYVLVCYPALLALPAQLFFRPRIKEKHSDRIGPIAPSP